MQTDIVIIGAKLTVKDTLKLQKLTSAMLLKKQNMQQNLQNFLAKI